METLIAIILYSMIKIKPEEKFLSLSCYKPFGYKYQFCWLESDLIK